MTQTPVHRLVAQLAVPTIISMLVTSLYNMADTFFVGRISTQATAAVGVVFSLMSVIQALGFFCGHGSGNFLSRRLGAGDVKEADEMAATGFVVAFMLGMIVLVFGECELTRLAVWLGATETIAGETEEYMRIILIGAPFMTTQLVINNQLRFQGSAVYAMVGLVSGAVLNIALDPLLIFYFKMGVSGAAAATVASQIISFLILWAGSHRGPNLHIKFKNVRLTKFYLLQIVNGGTASLFRQGMNAVAVIIMNMMAGSLGGDAAIAGMSVVNRVMLFANSALIGFGQGFQPVCAFNYGAGLYTRVKQAFWFCVKYGTFFLLAVSALCFVFAPHIIEFFRADSDVVTVGKAALRFQALSFPLGAFIVMSNMMLQSIGKGFKASVMASARTGWCFVPVILALSHIFGLGGVEMAQMFADIMAFIVAIPLSSSELRKMDKDKAA